MNASRLRVLLLIAGGALALASAPRLIAGDAPLKSIAVLDFDLLDDQEALAPASVEYARLTAIRAQLQQALTAERLYRVVDVAPASSMIDSYRSRFRLQACNGCELEIARALHADRVLVGWVQKVSNLILNINVRIEDAASGDVLLVRSVDLRGNTDETWRRGMAHLVQRIIDAGAGRR